MKKLILCGGLSLLVTACASGRHHKLDVPPPSANTVEALAANVLKVASLADHADDDKTRVRLAMQASSDSDACLKLEPHSAAC